jgi:valyl-tRNA synthetase
MLVALSSLLRLFAPFLPFVTEEIWSWWQPGSIHRAAWPTAEEVLEPIGGRDEPALAVRDATQAALADVRRIKSMLKKPVKAVIATATLPRRFEGLVGSQGDFMAATHIRELRFADGEASQLVFAEEAAAESRP